MASSLDRSEGEAAQKKNEAAEERKRVKEDKKNDVQAKKQRKTARTKNKKKSAARYDTRAMMKTMAMSVRPLYLMFASQEAARNPRAEVIPPSLMFIRPSPLR